VLGTTALAIRRRGRLGSRPGRALALPWWRPAARQAEAVQRRQGQAPRSGDLEFGRQIWKHAINIASV
jgi:hypothetical protein